MIGRHRGKWGAANQRDPSHSRRLVLSRRSTMSTFTRKLFIDTQVRDVISAPLAQKPADQEWASPGPQFSQTRQIHSLMLGDHPVHAQIRARMDRGFFLAGADWTCYRRNYFQLSCGFSAGDAESVVVDGMVHGIVGFQLGISARIARSDKQVDLVQHTPKRDKGPQVQPQPRPVAPNGNPHSYTGMHAANIAIFERVQFKSATANNGKRRAAQQYYSIHVDLFAVTELGAVFKVASCESAPLVVRGRSPGHYIDSKESPPTGVQFHMVQQPPFNTPARYDTTYAESPVYADSVASPYSALPFDQPPQFDDRFPNPTWFRDRQQSSQSVSSFITNDSYNSSFDTHADFMNSRPNADSSYQTPVTAGWSQDEQDHSMQAWQLNSPNVYTPHSTPHSVLTSSIADMQFNGPRSAPVESVQFSHKPTRFSNDNGLLFLSELSSEKCMESRANPQ